MDAGTKTMAELENEISQARATAARLEVELNECQSELRAAESELEDTRHDAQGVNVLRQVLRLTDLQWEQIRMAVDPEHVARRELVQARWTDTLTP